MAPHLIIIGIISLIIIVYGLFYITRSYISEGTLRFNSFATGFLISLFGVIVFVVVFLFTAFFSLPGPSFSQTQDYVSNYIERGSGHRARFSMFRVTRSEFLDSNNCYQINYSIEGASGQRVLYVHYDNEKIIEISSIPPEK